MQSQSDDSFYASTENDRIEELTAAVAELQRTCKALADDRDAKAEELRLVRPVIEAGAAIPTDNLIALTQRNGRRMAKWAQAELARRNRKTLAR